jgi:hypothetical protein
MAKKKLNSDNVEKKPKRKLKVGDKPLKIGDYGVDSIPVYAQKISNNKWRFTSKYGKQTVEAFSTTGKIRSPLTKPKVKSQKWRIVKKGKK